MYIYIYPAISPNCTKRTITSTPGWNLIYTGRPEAVPRTIVVVFTVCILKNKNWLFTARMCFLISGNIWISSGRGAASLRKGWRFRWRVGGGLRVQIPNLPTYIYIYIYMYIWWAGRHRLGCWKLQLPVPSATLLTAPWTGQRIRLLSPLVGRGHSKPCVQYAVLLQKREESREIHRIRISVRIIV